MMQRNLALELVRVTEAAAIASARTMGQGDSHNSDHQAVSAMRAAFDSLEINGAVVIGEGERDEAPMLYIGEQVGRQHDGDPGMDKIGRASCREGGESAVIGGQSNIK